MFVHFCDSRREEPWCINVFNRGRSCCVPACAPVRHFQGRPGWIWLAEVAPAPAVPALLAQQLAPVTHLVDGHTRWCMDGPEPKSTFCALVPSPAPAVKPITGKLKAANTARALQLYSVTEQVLFGMWFCSFPSSMCAQFACKVNPSLQDQEWEHQSVPSLPTSRGSAAGNLCAGGVAAQGCPQGHWSVSGGT